MTVAFWAGMFAAALTLINLISVIIVYFRCRLDHKHLPAKPDAPAVTIIRPVRGVDQFDEETLESTFHLDYPAYEAIFCVAHGHDPIVPILRRLVEKYPRIPARLLIGDDVVSGNPKLNNCIKGWDAAKHDWVVLADSNVLMPKDYVQRLQQSWRPKAGLVCSPPLGSRPGNFWAEVECAFLNTYQARWQFAGDALGFGFAQGKTMFWRRDVLENGGGIRALGAEIAEDAASTKLVRRQGLSVHLVDMPFEQPLGRRKPADVWARQARWARLRRVTFPYFYAPEILSGPALPTIAAAYAALHYSDNFAVVAAVILAVLVLWYGAEALLNRSTGWHQTWRFGFACVVRDVMLPFIWIDAWLVDDFTWRGNAMTVKEEERPAGSS